MSSWVGGLNTAMLPVDSQLFRPVIRTDSTDSLVLDGVQLNVSSCDISEKFNLLTRRFQACWSKASLPLTNSVQNATPVINSLGTLGDPDMNVYQGSQHSEYLKKHLQLFDAKLYLQAVIKVFDILDDATEKDNSLEKYCANRGFNDRGEASAEIGRILLDIGEVLCLLVSAAQNCYWPQLSFGKAQEPAKLLLNHNCLNIIKIKIYTFCQRHKDILLNILHELLAFTGWASSLPLANSLETSRRILPESPPTTNGNIASTFTKLSKLLICCQSLFMWAKSREHSTSALTRSNATTDETGLLINDARYMSNNIPCCPFLPLPCFNDVWLFKAMASKLVASFRFHFMNAASPLTTLHKPERPMSYLFGVYKYHKQIIENIGLTFSNKEYSNITPAFQHITNHDIETNNRYVEELCSMFNPKEGIAMVLVSEIVRYIRAIVPILVYEPELSYQSCSHANVTDAISKKNQIIEGINLKSLLTKRDLKTIKFTVRAMGKDNCDNRLEFIKFMKELVKAREDWSTEFPAAAALLFRDFEANAKLAPPFGRNCKSSSISSYGELTKGSSLSNVHESLSSNIDSHLPKESTSNSRNEKIGILEFWCETDRQLILMCLRKTSNDETFATQGVGPAAIESDHLYRGIVFRENRMTDILVHSVLSRKLVEVLKVSEGRADCLSSARSLSLFSEQVYGPAIQLFREEAVKSWNMLHDPLTDLKNGSAVLIQSTWTVWVFLRHEFAYGPYITTDTSDLLNLHKRMISKLVSSVQDEALRALRSVLKVPSVMGTILENSLQAVRGAVVCRAVATIIEDAILDVIEECLVNYLSERVTLFHSDSEKGVFVSNCQSVISTLKPAASAGSPRMLAVKDIVNLLTLPPDLISNLLPKIQNILHFGGGSKVVNQNEAQEQQNSFLSLYVVEQVGKLAENVWRLRDKKSAIAHGNGKEEDLSYLSQKEAEILSSFGVSTYCLSDCLRIIKKRKEFYGF